MLDLRLQTQVVPWHQDGQLSLSPRQGTLHEKTGAMLPGHTPSRGERLWPLLSTLLWGQQQAEHHFHHL